MKNSKKIVLMGHFGVGKTSLFRRFIDDEFSEDYKVTLGVQIKKKSVQLPDGTRVSLIFWDTEGHIHIEDTRRSYLLGSDAFIYVCDVSRAETFVSLNEDIVYLKDNHPDVPIKSIGNKIDLIEEKQQLFELFEKHQVSMDILTSAKTNENVQTLLMEISTEVSSEN